MKDKTPQEEPLFLISNENEMATLGSMLYGPKVAQEVFMILTPKDFGVKDNAIIYSAMLRLRAKNVSIDPITLETELHLSGELESAGGRAMILRLAECVASPANAKYYAQNVYEYATLRRAEYYGTKIQELVRETDLTVEDKIDKAREMMSKLSSRKTKSNMSSIADGMMAVVQEMDASIEDGKSQDGVMTGFYDLDEMTSGLFPGDLFIIAARPSMGKTALAMNIGMNISKKADKPVLVFSIEMPAIQIWRRMVSMISKVSTTQLKSAYTMSQSQIYAATNAAEELYNSKLWLDDSSEIKESLLFDKARQVKTMYGISAIIVDYLQLITVNVRSQNRANDVTSIVRTLKSMAKELGVPVIALSQLSRTVEARDVKRPNMSDLKDSGSIEAEADIVTLIYREAYYDRKSEPQYSTHEKVEHAELIVAKNRNGATGTIKLGFMPEYTSFHNVRL